MVTEGVPWQKGRREKGGFDMLDCTTFGGIKHAET